MTAPPAPAAPLDPPALVPPLLTVPPAPAVPVDPLLPVAPPELVEPLVPVDPLVPVEPPVLLAPLVPRDPLLPFEPLAPSPPPELEAPLPLPAAPEPPVPSELPDEHALAAMASTASDVREKRLDLMPSSSISALDARDGSVETRAEARDDRDEVVGVAVAQTTDFRQLNE